MDRFWASTIVIFMIMMATFNMVSSNIFFTQLDDINNILYTNVNVMAKKGEVSETVLSNMQRQLNKYGGYELKLVASSQDEGIQLSGSDLINVDLRREGYDTLSVSVKYVDSHIYQFFVNRTYFGQKIGDSEIKLFGTVQTYIR